LLLLLAIPFQVEAAQYVVRAGDTLSAIAQRHHISLALLARLNGITNINLIRIGQVLLIPVQVHTFYYRVRWGDTLSGIALRYGTDIATLRSLNPRLGVYPLAGQLLRVCRPCSSGATYQVAPQPAPSGRVHIVRPGETLSSIAGSFGLSTTALMSANHITNPDLIVIGSSLLIPSVTAATAYDPYAAKALIIQDAERFGIEPALPLAVAWQESGFNQSMVSRTGAIGVMQVEPYTGAHIEDLLGRQLNLYNLDDNVLAGVYWLSVLLRYYGGDERMAVAAYYEGTRAIAHHGLYQDTVQYVADVLALKSGFGP
jgi:LysM repeat protein